MTFEEYVSDEILSLSTHATWFENIGALQYAQTLRRMIYDYENNHELLKMAWEKERELLRNGI